MRKGVEKGIEKGIEKGKSEALINVARQLLAYGMSVEEVADITKLSLDEIRNI